MQTTSPIGRVVVDEVVAAIADEVEGDVVARQEHGDLGERIVAASGPDGRTVSLGRARRARPSGRNAEVYSAPSPWSAPAA